MSLAESAIAETAIADSAFFAILVSGSDTIIVSIVDEKTISLNNNIYITSDISPSYIENTVSMQSVFTSADANIPVLLTDEYSFPKILRPGFLMSLAEPAIAEVAIADSTEAKEVFLVTSLSDISPSVLESRNNLISNLGSDNLSLQFLETHFPIYDPPSMGVTEIVDMREME